jgi:DNA-binding NtrC family response regulator
MPEKILVIEDMDDDDAYLARALQQAGFDAVGVAYGRDARETILRLHGEGGFRLVIADLTMREPLGLEALRFIQQHLAPIPVIGIGDGAGAVSDALASLGALGVWQKPLAWHGLLSFIRAILAEPAAMASPASRATAPLAIRPRRRIVLLGHDQDFCEALASDLERRGHEVLAFLDSSDAIGTIARSPATWDLVVIQDGPTMAGRQVRDDLAAVRPGLPVVLSDGWPNLLNECRNYHDGAQRPRAVSAPCGMLVPIS